MNYFEMYVAYEFIRLLTVPWIETEAYKLGVINENGELLIPGTKLNSKQKKAYTIFHRLVWNIRRLIEKAPGGTSKIAGFSAALWLLKEPPVVSQPTQQSTKTGINKP